MIMWTKAATATQLCVLLAVCKCSNIASPSFTDDHPRALWPTNIGGHSWSRSRLCYRRGTIMDNYPLLSWVMFAGVAPLAPRWTSIITPSTWLSTLMANGEKKNFLSNSLKLAGAADRSIDLAVKWNVKHFYVTFGQNFKNAFAFLIFISRKV